jgi:hypothetical protein
MLAPPSRKNHLTLGRSPDCAANRRSEAILERSHPKSGSGIRTDISVNIKNAGGCNFLLRIYTEELLRLSLAQGRKSSAREGTGMILVAQRGSIKRIAKIHGEHREESTEIGT